jgi:uncharacterized repeat protein (TIGR02543 family)
MKHIIVFTLLVICSFLTCANNHQMAGTGEEVNNGSLFGKVVNDVDNKPIDDTITVSLYIDTTADEPSKACSKGQNAFKTMITIDGNYKFDSLPEGSYCIKVTKDSLAMSKMEGIALECNENKEVNITVNITINVTFNIQANQSQIVNNFYIGKGNVLQTDSGFTLSLAELDTPRFYITIKKDEDTSIVEIRAVRNDDGTLTLIILENPVDLTVIPKSDKLSIRMVPTYDVSYNGNGYTNGVFPSKKAFISGDKISVCGRTSLIRLGHTFTGWNTEADGSGIGYAAGDTLTVDTRNITLFAQWSKIETHYGMVRIPARDSSFLMGNDVNFPILVNNATGYTCETPLHTVKFSYDFMMDSTEVTQLEYASLMAKTYNSPKFNCPRWDSGSGDKYPAYNMNWYDAVLYCNARTLQSGTSDTVYSYTNIAQVPGCGSTLIDLRIDLSKRGFRLPTEAEWEYACRAGSKTDFYWGKDYDSLLYPISAADSNQIDSFIVWPRNSSEKGVGDPDYGTHRVAQKLANAFHLYDMIGNVWEWCNDRFGSDYYSNSPIDDPMGPEIGGYRVTKGGSWRKAACPKALYFRSSIRVGVKPETLMIAAGFRVALPLR